MSDVIQCDICGSTYERKGFAEKFAKIDVPLRYKIWEVVPRNRDKVGFVKQDICRGCRGEFEEAVRLLKERKGESDE